MSAANATAGAAPSLNRGMITLSTMLATIMQAVDTTIANVALPHMQGSMSATQEQISWVLTSYIVAAAIMTPPTGILAARLGRKRLFLIAVVGFTIASMLCGAATSLTEIVIFRLLQGVFGASLVPLSQSVLLDTYPKEKHGQAMAIWGVGVMVGPILGPTLGGYLTDLYEWRWVFYINLPFGILALLGIMTFVPETEKDPTRRFDVFGFTLLSLAIGALQMMLDRGQSRDWFTSGEIVAEAVIAGLALYLFLVHMFTAKKPFIEPGLFKDKNFAVGVSFMFMIGIILLSTMALLPPFLQNLMGYPVITTGFVLAPRGVGTMLAMFVVGKLMGRVAPRWLIVTGLAFLAISLWDMAHFTTDVSIGTLVYTGVVQGLGFGFVFVPLTTIAFATLAQHYRTEGTAMFSLIRNLGSSIGVSIAITVLAQQTQIVHAGLANTMTPFRDMMNPSLLPHVWDWTTQSGIVALNEAVTRQAATVAYLNDFTFMMWVTIAALPLAFLLKAPKSAPPAADAAAAME